MTDEAGQTVQGYEYDSFGRIINRSGNIPPNPFTFTGREHDEETGLYYAVGDTRQPRKERVADRKP